MLELVTQGMQGDDLEQWAHWESGGACRLQVAPYDFLAEDAVLSAEGVARERREAAMWLGDGVYALLPYSSLILESVPHQERSSWDGTPLMPTAAAAPATVAATRYARQLAAHCCSACLNLTSQGASCFCNITWGADKTADIAVLTAPTGSPLCRSNGKVPAKP